eukprot:Seg2089.5 transcript_id=Seg2089.5/GoldUCD/mRNA.D3Y31 product="Phosphatidylinositol 5-phosphate 4-kinase type-2 alpha" protein_id=Seg2089.5/GoldUCD/D3Y31
MADSAAISLTKMKKKKKKIKAFHQKKKLFRAQDPKISVLMWGICHSVNELTRVSPNVMLLKEDFKAFGKVIIKNHNYSNESMPSHFKFKEYCPRVFQNLRERFDIDDQFYGRSFQEAPEMSEASGNSGSKFFETVDKAFIVKTIESEEVEMMHHLLPKYHAYIVECHGETLLPQYLGMYRVTVDGKEYYYITFRNIFSLNKTIHKKYDLKGSRVARGASESEKNKDIPTFKDNDFTRDNVKLLIGKEMKSDLLTKIRKDIEFLSAQNLMDYSLLVGIHEEDRLESDDDLDGDVTNGRSENDDSAEDSPSSPVEDERRPMMGRSNSVTSGGDIPVMDGERYAITSSRDSKHETYYLGIIDVLTYYGANKKAAHAAKTVKHGAGAEISTVNPGYYATRFMDFIEEVMS